MESIAVNVDDITLTRKLNITRSNYLQNIYDEIKVGQFPSFGELKIYLREAEYRVLAKNARFYKRLRRERQL